MRVRLFFLLALLLFALSACGGTTTPGSKAGISLLSNSSIQTLRIATTYPQNMQVNDSYQIRVSLTPLNGVSLKTIIATEQATQVATEPTPVGTPGATMLNAFGKGYEPYARAALAASSFQVVSTQPDEQSLEQPSVEWDWDVTPSSAGTQVIFVDIWIQWLPVHTNGTPLPPPTYRLGENQLAIGVAGTPPPPQSWIDWTGVVTTVVSALLVSLLSWFGVRLTKQFRRRAKQQSNDTSTSTQH